jgi:hypothetical protein
MLSFDRQEHVLWMQAGDASLHDTCYVLVPPDDSKPDVFGYRAEGHPDDWHQEGPVACGIRLGDPDDRSGTVRLPRDLDLPDRARLVITARRGRTIPALVFSITDGPRIGSAVQTVRVVREEGTYPL